MNQKTAEEVLSDEIELFSPDRLFVVAEDLQALIDQGILKETGGSHALKDLKQLPSLEMIEINFETIPGGTKYYISYHGGGMFKKGDAEEDFQKALEKKLASRMKKNNER